MKKETCLTLAAQVATENTFKLPRLTDLGKSDFASSKAFRCKDKELMQPQHGQTPGTRKHITPSYPNMNSKPFCLIFGVLYPILLWALSVSALHMRVGLASPEQR